VDVFQSTYYHAGCSVGRGAFAQKITLNVWLMVQADVNLLKAQEDALVEFKMLYPDIDVKFTVFPYNEYRDKLLMSAAAGNPPDISVVDQIWNQNFLPPALSCHWMIMLLNLKVSKKNTTCRALGILLFTKESYMVFLLM
jgi:hypothetical protein